jgi:hypothetical protein
LLGREVEVELSRINKILDNFPISYLQGYDGGNCVLTLRLEAGGGVWETFDGELSFQNVQVFHLPRVFHFPLGLRSVAPAEIKDIVPGYDEEDRQAKCFVITRDGADTGFYVYADTVELSGVPDSVPI